MMNPMMIRQKQTISNLPSQIPKRILIFTCDDLGENVVTLVVADEVGNTSECTSIIFITDPENYCTHSSSKNVSPSLLYKLFPNPSEGFYIQRNSVLSSAPYSVKIIDFS